MSIFNIFRRKPGNDEASRRAHLLRTGRIAEGTILDVGTDETGTLMRIFYSCHINGVDYESSQLLDDEQHRRLSDYTPGARVTIRYDPHQPTNSIVV